MSESRKKLLSSMTPSNPSKLIALVSFVALAMVGCATAQSQQAEKSDGASRDGAEQSQPTKPDSTAQTGRPTIQISLSALKYRGETIRQLDGGRLDGDTWVIDELRQKLVPLTERQGALDILAKEDWPLIETNDWVPYRTLLAVIVTASRTGRARVSLSIDESEPIPVVAPAYGATLPEGAFGTREGKLDLVVSMLEGGFQMFAAGAALPPVDGCPENGPTICNAHPREPGILIDNGRGSLIEGEPTVAADAMSRLRQGYNWSRLSEKLKSLNQSANANDMWRDDIVTVSLAEEMPVALLSNFYDANCDRPDGRCYFNRIVLGPATDNME